MRSRFGTGKYQSCIFLGDDDEIEAYINTAET
jgi:hypothetical protein